MIRLIALFFILAGSCFAVTPVKDIRLQGTADGGGVLFTNLSDIVTTNGVKLSEVLTVSALANTVTNAGTRVNGSPLTNGAALLVGTVREIVGTNGLTVSQASGPITIISAAAMLTNATGAGRLTLGISGQTVTGAVDVSGLATGAPIYSLAGYATGTPVYTTAGLATGTPLYVESDPVFVAASNALLTKAQAALIYATGTPVYAVSGLGTDTTARAWAVGASNRADAAYAIAAAAATGTPLYVSSLAALSNSVANATATGSLALAWAQAGSNLAASAIAWGNHATNGYAVNGQNITGRWFAVGNTNSGENSFIGGGQGNYAYSNFSTISGGRLNMAGFYASVLGGNQCLATGMFSSIGGGQVNKAYGRGSSIIGGEINESFGDYSTVAGGQENSANGYAAFVAGGLGNNAGDYSFAAGWNASATNSGSFVFSSPGTVDNNFGSLGDNTFNVRAVGGVYFLSTDFWIQDTNGNTIARFSGTNTTISGSLNLTGYATTSDVLTAGAVATNAQIAASNAQTTASAATNLAYAIGAGATNGILNVGLVATNAQQVASNGLATAQAAQVQASNINAGAWSQIATGAVSMATNRINQISAISFVNNATIGDIDYGLLFTNGYPAYAQGSSRYSFYGTWNFSPSSYQTAAAQASYATNAIKLFAGIVTQNQITARNQAFFDGTNIWIGLGGTNSLRMGGVLNAY